MAMGGEAQSDAQAQERSLCRRTRRGEERCERVRAVAAELFLERGFDGVSLDDIIARSGGSKTNIYSHFGGKEGLFIAIIEGLCDQVNATLRALDLSSASLEEGLKLLGRTLMKAVLDKRHLGLYRLVIGQSARIPDVGCPWKRHGPDETRRIITEFLDRYRNRLRNLSPEQAATIYHNMLIWDRMNCALFAGDGGPDDAAVGAHVDEILTLFAQGYIHPA